VDFDLHGRPPFVPPPLLELDEWPPCSLGLDLHHNAYRWYEDNAKKRGRKEEARLMEEAHKRNEATRERRVSKRKWCVSELGLKRF